MEISLENAYQFIASIQPYPISRIMIKTNKEFNIRTEILMYKS